MYGFTPEEPMHILNGSVHDTKNRLVTVKRIVRSDEDVILREEHVTAQCGCNKP